MEVYSIKSKTPREGAITPPIKATLIYDQIVSITLLVQLHHHATEALGQLAWHTLYFLEMAIDRWKYTLGKYCGQTQKCASSITCTPIYPLQYGAPLTGASRP